jgi:dTDP-4-dehydrorhamnose reductase
LGHELKQLVSQYPRYSFLFVTKEELPIDNYQKLRNYFENARPVFCINCAAYTAVDKAESEKKKAFLINGEAAGNLASLCKNFNTRYIHISTDYVFNGTSSMPYKETDLVDPVNTYGASKLRGEQLAIKNNPESIIIRTSWVFSSFGSNFVKTMLRLMSERVSLNVVNDQQGCPTYAADLAKTIMKFVEALEANGGIYHYCNEGITTWFDFAVAIKELAEKETVINPISTSQFPTSAKRPQYSVLDTTKIKGTLNITIPHWKEALSRCLAKL